MANQTELLNVSDEMKLNDNVQSNDVKEQEENLYSSSLDTTEELCSSSEPDTCGDGMFAFQTSCKTEYRSGIENERDGFNGCGEESHLRRNQRLCTGHTGLKVSNLYIAQVKQKCGIIERENYNKPKSDSSKKLICPAEKEEAIKDAFKYFKMI